MNGGWVRPILNDSRNFNVSQGRHPVVEAALKVQSSAVFVANDCNLNGTADTIWLLNGSKHGR